MMGLAFLCAETSEATHQGGCSERHLPVAFILKALEGDQKETPAVLTESDRAASMWHAAKVIYQRRILTK